MKLQENDKVKSVTLIPASARELTNETPLATPVAFESDSTDFDSE